MEERNPQSIEETTLNRAQIIPQESCRFAIEIDRDVQQAGRQAEERGRPGDRGAFQHMPPSSKAAVPSSSSSSSSIGAPICSSMACKIAAGHRHGQSDGARTHINRAGKAEAAQAIDRDASASRLKSTKS